MFSPYLAQVSRRRPAELDGAARDARVTPPIELLQGIMESSEDAIIGEASRSPPPYEIPRPSASLVTPPQRRRTVDADRCRNTCGDEADRHGLRLLRGETIGAPRNYAAR